MTYHYSGWIECRPHSGAIMTLTDLTDQQKVLVDSWLLSNSRSIFVLGKKRRGHAPKCASSQVASQRSLAPTQGSRSPVLLRLRL